MTTDPKFVPKDAAEIQFGEGKKGKVRLVDCVGFMVEGATGHTENDDERLVKTPWFEEAIPFTRAAEIGSQKVIREHSNIGIIITTDGSFGQLPACLSRQILKPRLHQLWEVKNRQMI